jgi:hypothetical protein
MANADNVAHETIQFEECGRSEAMEFAMLSMKRHYNRRYAHISFNKATTCMSRSRLREAMRSGWWWSTKKDVGVFESYCNEIRNLAVSGTPLAFDASGSVRGASSIPVTV